MSARPTKRERAERLLREARVDDLWRSIANAAAGMRLAVKERDASNACGHTDAALQALEELDRIGKNEGGESEVEP